MSALSNTHTDLTMSDPIDRASAEELRFLDLKTRAIQTTLRIQAAAGESVYCTDCGKEIAIERRRAVPGVRRCISCQRSAEETQQ